MQFSIGGLKPSVLFPISYFVVVLNTVTLVQTKYQFSEIRDSRTAYMAWVLPFVWSATPMSDVVNKTVWQMIGSLSLGNAFYGRSAWKTSPSGLSNRTSDKTRMCLTLQRLVEFLTFRAILTEGN